MIKLLNSFSIILFYYDNAPEADTMGEKAIGANFPPVVNK